MRGWLILGALGTVAGATALWLWRPTAIAVGTGLEAPTPVTEAPPAAPATLEPASLPAVAPPAIPAPAPNPLPPLYRACMAASAEQAPEAYRALISADAVPAQWAALAEQIRASMVPAKAAGERAVRRVRILQGIDRTVANRRFMLRLAAESPDAAVRLVSVRFLGYQAPQEDDGFRPLRSPKREPPTPAPEAKPEADLVRRDVERLARTEPDPEVVEALVEVWLGYPRKDLPKHFWVTVAAGVAKPVERLMAARALEPRAEWKAKLLIRLLRDTGEDRVSVAARAAAAHALQHAAKFGGEAAEALLDALREDPAASVREEALYSLYELCRDVQGLRHQYARPIRDAAALDPVAENRELAGKLFGK